MLLGYAWPWICASSYSVACTMKLLPSTFAMMFMAVSSVHERHDGLAVRRHLRRVDRERALVGIRGVVFRLLRLDERLLRELRERGADRVLEERRHLAAAVHVRADDRVAREAHHARAERLELDRLHVDA